MEEGKLVWPKELPPVSNFPVVAAVTSAEEETAHVNYYHMKRTAYRWKLRGRTSGQNLLADLPLGPDNLSDFTAVWIIRCRGQKRFGKSPNFSGSSSCRCAGPNADEFDQPSRRGITAKVNTGVPNPCRIFVGCRASRPEQFVGVAQLEHEGHILWSNSARMLKALQKRSCPGDCRENFASALSAIKLLGSDYV